MTAFHPYPDYSDTQMEKRAESFIAEGKAGLVQADAFRQILGMIDLTTLEGADNKEKIDNLCQKARSFEDPGSRIPNVAAVCVYPPFIKQAREKLRNSGIRVASVAGAFPSGQSPLYVRLAEVQYAVDAGADEIDMVISRGKLLEGNYQEVSDEIAATKEVCGKVHLKVILETGELGSFANIRIASELAILAGGDFIKTSTGKIPVSATLTASLVMLDTLREYHEKTGKMIGFKPAGGISDPAQALDYYCLVAGVLGQKWLSKEYFRYGASRLADKIFSVIAK